MGELIAFTAPVQPGKSDRVRSFGEELAEHQAEFERLNKEATVTRFAITLQETPMGDFAIFLTEADDPTRLPRTFTDSAYDTWWVAWLKDVIGLDLAAMPEPPAPPQVAYDWNG